MAETSGQKAQAGTSEAGRPLVTVIIGSYNHEKFVQKAIKSILNQTYQNIELIVIDDGSPDGSRKRIQELHEETKFQYIEKDNGGLISVINMGIGLGRGEYTVLHASDDESYPDRIQRQVDVLSRNKNAAFVSGNLQFEKENGIQAGTLLPITGEVFEYEFEDIFLQKKTVSSVATMYRTKALRQMRPLDTKYRAEDPIIFLRATASGSTWLQSQDMPVIKYRMLHSSLSRTVMRSLVEEHIEKLREFRSHPKYDLALKIARASLISSLAEQSKIEALKEILKGKISLSSPTFLRAIAKLLLPIQITKRLKRAGRGIPRP